MNDERQKNGFEIELTQADLRRIDNDTIKRMWTGSKMQLKGNIRVRIPQWYGIGAPLGWAK